MRYVLLWAAFQAALALLLLLWWDDPLANGLAWAAVALALALAALAWRPRDRSRVVPDTSFGVILVALGIAAIVAGLALGEWQLYLGAFFGTIGLAVLAREALVQRRRS